MRSQTFRKIVSRKVPSPAGVATGLWEGALFWANRNGRAKQHGNGRGAQA
jgi:hypothetical protein